MERGGRVESESGGYHLLAGSPPTGENWGGACREPLQPIPYQNSPVLAHHKKTRVVPDRRLSTNCSEPPDPIETNSFSTSVPPDNIILEKGRGCPKVPGPNRFFVGGFRSLYYRRGPHPRSTRSRSPRRKSNHLSFNEKSLCRGNGDDSFYDKYR